MDADRDRQVPEKYKGPHKAGLQAVNSGDQATVLAVSTYSSIWSKFMYL